MILLCGLTSEAPLVLVANALTAAGEPFLFVDQRHQGDADLLLELDGPRIGGRLRYRDRHLPLCSVRAVYTRWTDCTQVPSFARFAAAEKRRARKFQEDLVQWLEISPGRVVNRTSAMGSNSSKPYQAQVLLRAGFAIPETLVSNDPERVARFAATHGEVIYKSISGVRSIVRTLRPEDRQRLERIRGCPVQFQERIPGTDVRVHVVGGEVFATRIESEATDYRYADRESGQAARLEGCELPVEVAARCVDVAATLRLELAGIDLRQTPAGEFYCFEVNPSPAFSYYENQTGQPIARAVAAHLAAPTAPR